MRANLTRPRHRGRPRLGEPVADGTLPVLITAPRLVCSCGSPGARRGQPPCPVCQAWEQGYVPLADGTTVPRAPWLHAHMVPEEEPHG